MPRISRFSTKFFIKIGQAFRWLTFSFSSTLSRRIVVLNLAGLFALVLGILYVNTLRAGLIEARTESLKVQSQLIASAVAAAATVETDVIRVDPNKLLQLKPGESIRIFEDTIDDLDFTINPERIGVLLSRLVSPTRTHARIYDRDTSLLLDSQSFYSKGEVIRFSLPPTTEKPGWLDEIYNAVQKILLPKDFPILDEIALSTRGHPDIQKAMEGEIVSEVRLNTDGEIITSVAVPIQRFREIQGVLLLSTLPGDIDSAIIAEKKAIIQVFLVAVFVMLLLSLFLAGTIAGPIRRLSDAAERVKKRVQSRIEIPNYTYRSDEIGHLSLSLRDMTQTLYNRIEAIERFAADVAHELKNPLTSLRSAVEVFPKAKNDEAKTKLLSIIEHDVKRLDRLITDISDASRLDAELQREEGKAVDIGTLLDNLVLYANQFDGAPKVNFTSTQIGNTKFESKVQGHEGRLAQVFNNLFDNARSFSPENGKIEVEYEAFKDKVIIQIKDQGTGIQNDAFEKIFERFYTDRPEHAFGNNSGLGLSISKQIIEAHGGTISAQNIKDGDVIKGAHFIIELPKTNET